jgi:hypothetical protein
MGELPTLYRHVVWQISPTGEVQSSVDQQFEFEPHPGPKRPPPAADGLYCAAKCDLSSRAGLERALTEIVGRPLPKDACIDRPMKDVVRYGVRNFDKTCEWDDVFVGCCQAGLYNDDRRVMARLGWKEADPEKRRKLALDWETKVATPAGDLVTKASPDFGGEHPAWSAPAATVSPDGGVVVTYWKRMHNENMLPGVRYWQTRVTFSADGSTEGRVVEQIEDDAAAAPKK